MAVSLREVLSFGRYEPLFRVAAGGMAEVYAARIQGEAGFQKLVAVKRMLPHLASEPGFVDMFLNEAKLAAYVASPHVVTTLDLGRGTEGSLYIVMELVVGLSLAKLMAQQALPVAVAAELMAQAAQGLDDAHEACTPAGDALGLIHRDVSPHNILVGLDGRARVTDFGIARAVHRPRPETNIRELKGTFAYMSPEQTRLEPLDRRSDVFSLGIVLWETLVGTGLFAHRDPMEAIRLLQRRRVSPPHEIAPDVPEAISLVAMRALERDRTRRYASAGELALELRRAARETLGEPPHRKQVAAFVEEAGGEELARLQRLIRLGTEGAAPEAIEAVQRGITKVLPEDLSGVAPLAKRARRTAVIASTERSAAERDVAIPTGGVWGGVAPPETIESDDDEAEPSTVMLPSGEPVSEPPTAIFENPSHSYDELPTPMATAIPDDREGLPTRTDAVLPDPAPTIVAPRRKSTRAWGVWMALATIAASLVLGVTLAIGALWHEKPSRAVLPLAPEPVLPPPVQQLPPPPIEPEPAPVPTPIAEPVIEPPTPVRHHRARPRAIRTIEPPTIEPRPLAPTRPRAPLLDVDDFDRRPR